MRKKESHWIIRLMLIVCLIILFNAIIGRLNSQIKGNSVEPKTGKSTVSYSQKYFFSYKPNQQRKSNYQAYTLFGPYSLFKWERNPPITTNQELSFTGIGTTNSILSKNTDSKIVQSAPKYEERLRIMICSNNSYIYNQDTVKNTKPVLASYQPSEITPAPLLRRNMSTNFVDVMMMNDGINGVSDQDRINYAMNKLSDFKAPEVVLLGALLNSMGREQTLFSMNTDKIKLELKTTPKGFVNVFNTWRQGDSDTINNRLLSTVINFNDASKIGLKLDLGLDQIDMVGQKVTDSEWDAALKLGFKF